MNTDTQQNIAIKGLLKAYKLLENTNVATNSPSDMGEIERDICDIFGWQSKTLTKETFTKNLNTVCDLIGIEGQ